MLTCSQTLFTLLQLFEESEIPGNFSRHCGCRVFLGRNKQSTAAVVGKVLVEATPKRKRPSSGRGALTHWYPTYLLQNSPPPISHVMIMLTCVLSPPWRFLEMPRLTFLLIDQHSVLKIGFGDSLPGKLLTSWRVEYSSTIARCEN